MNYQKISKKRFFDALQEFSKSSQKYWRENFLVNISLRMAVLQKQYYELLLTIMITTVQSVS